jgi:hypothetical protein
MQRRWVGEGLAQMRASGSQPKPNTCRPWCQWAAGCHGWQVWLPVKVGWAIQHIGLAGNNMATDLSATSCLVLHYRLRLRHRPWVYPLPSGPLPGLLLPVDAYVPPGQTIPMLTHLQLLRTIALRHMSQPMGWAAVAGWG